VLALSSAFAPEPNRVIVAAQLKPMLAAIGRGLG